MNRPGELVAIANARLPSQRAQSLQVVQMAAAFARAGAPHGLAVHLLHADRKPPGRLPAGVDLLEYYEVGAGARPDVLALACVDWIDRVPTALQFVPARLQEWTFSRSAARLVSLRHRGALVYSRELEAARALVRARVRGAFSGRVFFEVHRVPEGRLRREWLRQCLPLMDGWVAISGGVREDLLALGVDPARMCVEHDGFEASRFARISDRDAARARLGVQTGRPLVVYTGSLLEWKGVDVLLEAVRAMPEVEVRIAGGPEPLALALRERARGLDHVRVDGFVPPKQVADYLAAADLGVVPNRSKPAISARYTSPLKVFEALAVGLPLVCSDLPSLRDVLTHGEDAWLVAPDDPRALAAGIAKLLSEPDLAQRLARAGKQRAARYTWDARAARLLRWMGAMPEGVGR